MKLRFWNKYLMTFDRPPKFRIFFLHIEKTGGTSVASALIDAVNDCSVIKWDAEDQIIQNLSNNKKFYSDVRILCGHYNFGIHSKLEKDCVSFYFSILREPLDRVVSLYVYQRQTPGDAGYELANSHDINSYIIRLIDEGSIWVNNFQTYRLTGLDECQSNFEALNFIKKNIDCVITTEKIDKFLTLILSTNLRRYDKFTNSKTLLNEITSDTKNKFYKLNQTDLYVYNYYRDLELVKNNKVVTVLNQVVRSRKHIAPFSFFRSWMTKLFLGNAS